MTRRDDREILTTLTTLSPHLIRYADSPSNGIAMRHLALAVLTAAAALLAACRAEPDAAAPEVRPVRTVTVAKHAIGETVTYTGHIRAENEARLAFRISGRARSSVLLSPRALQFSEGSLRRCASMPAN